MSPLLLFSQAEEGPYDWLHKLDEHYAFFNKNGNTSEAWQRLKALEQDFQLYTGAHRAFLETEMLFHRARFISRQFPYLAPGEDEALLDTAFQRLNALDTTQLPDTLRLRYAWLEASLLGEKAIFFQYELEDLKQADKLWRAAQLAFKRLPPSPKVKRGLYVAYVNWLNVKFFLLDLEEGVQIGQEALQMAQFEKETAFEAYLAHNLGNLYREQNQFQEAEALYNRARVLYEELGDTLHLGGLLNNLAILLDRRFREGEAYLLYLKALELIGEAQPGNVKARVNLLCSLGTLTNQPEDTWGYLEEAEQLALAFNLPKFWLWQIYENQIFHANVRKWEGLWVAAIKKAEQLYPQMDWANHPILHTAYFEAQGDYFQHRRELAAALEAYHKGLGVLKPFSHFHLQKQIILRNKIAKILLQQGQYEEALAHYDQNLANNPLSKARIEDMPEEALVHFKAYFADMEGRMGVCQALALKMPQQALFWLGQAEKGALCLDSILVKAESPDFFPLDRWRWSHYRIRCTEQQLDIYEAYLKSGPYAEEFVQGAFRALERGKAVLLLETQTRDEAARKAGLPDTLRQKEKQLEARLMNFQLKAELGEINQKGLNYTQQEWEALQEHFAQQYPDYHQWRYTASLVPLPQVQAALTKNQVMLTYFIGKKATYVLVITAKKADLVRLSDEPLVEIDRALQTYYLALQRGSQVSQFAPAAHRVYEIFLAPIEKYLAADSEIILIPDQNLNFTPIEATLRQLPPAEVVEENLFGKLDYFTHHYPIIYQYSASLWWQGQKRISVLPPSFAGFAPFASLEPLSSRTRSGNDQKLPGTGLEIAYIVQRCQNNNIPAYSYFSEAASKAQFEAACRQYRWVHFAGHSQGQTRQAEARLLFKANTSPMDEESSLLMGEIFSWKLDNELVVLSSCESGSGLWYHGEGDFTLARAFIRAGAQNVVYSLWAVNDENTRKLMVLFYEYIFASRANFSDALHRAKQTLIQSNLYLPPREWCGFRLVGKGF
ncbi:MAG: hypothetical protein OHK0053_03720 [Microscillaceae bacterium]